MWTLETRLQVCASATFWRFCRPRGEFCLEIELGKVADLQCTLPQLVGRLHEGAEKPSPVDLQTLGISRG